MYRINDKARDKVVKIIISTKTINGKTSHRKQKWAEIRWRNKVINGCTI